MMNHKDNTPSSKKKFYDADFTYQENSSSSKATDNHSKSDDTIKTSDHSTKAPGQLGRSMRRVKQLFEQAARTEKIQQNPYKSVPKSNPSINHSVESDNNKQHRNEKLKKQPFSNEKPVTSTEVTYSKMIDKPIETPPTRTSRIVSATGQRPPLPTPEEIRAEREARRRARIEELERLSTPDDVEKSYRHVAITAPTDTDVTFSKQIPNKKQKVTVEKDIPTIQTNETEVTDDTTIQSIKETVAELTVNSESTPTSATENIKELTPILDGLTEKIEHATNLTHDISDENSLDSPIVSEISEVEKIGVPKPSLLSRFSRKKNAKTKKESTIYSLDTLKGKSKFIFWFNVFFNVIKRFAIYLILIGILLGGMAGGIGAGYFAYLVSQTPPPTREEMAEKINRIEQQSTLYYADGSQIANIRADIVRNVAELKDISPYIIDGLVATEDEYFYEHHGVVPKAILRATLQAVLAAGGGTGGSTLTQQLVKQQLLSNDVTFFRKANEILLALRLENYFSKDEILTAYLNVSSFGRNNSGDNIAGILSASKGIFGKSPNEVNLPQAAFLVGLPQAPYAYTPYDQLGQLKGDFKAGISRMKDVLFRMYRTEKITKEQYEEAIAYDITKDFLPTEQRSVERQTYLYHAMMHGAVEQLMRLNIAAQNLTWEQVNQDPEWYNQFYYEAEEQLRTGGYRVYTTIDKNIYDQLQISAANHINELGASYDGVHVNEETGEENYYVETVQSGVVVIENATGKVLGFVSGTDYDNNQIDHAFRMRRSPGSTIKPLAVYAPAIEHNLINPSTVIPDTAFEYTYEDGTTWMPTNYGGVVSGGFMTARTALLRSDNLPAVRIYQQLVEQNIPVFDYLKKMGFDVVDAYTEEDTKNLAFSLGGVTTGPTVFEQTSAFTTFANKGQYIDGYYIERIEDTYGNVVYQHDVEPVRVFSEDTNYLVVDMLRDTNTEGTGRTAAASMVMGGDWIAKSGISENSRDVWYIASTPSITIGTWIGYDNRYVDYYIDINDGFGRESERIQLYWANLANELYEKYPNLFGTDQVFAKPDTVQETAIVQTTGTLPGALNVNGVNVAMNNPMVNEVFKVTNPAPVLNYNFMFGASDEETQTFWNTYVQQALEAIRQQQAAQNNRSSSSSNNDNNQNNETTTTSPAETTTTNP